MKATKRHLYEVDFMRSFIILGVVCVHVLSFYNLFNQSGSSTQLTFETLLSTFHFTREAFLFLTGLVLFVTYHNKTFRAIDFWKKRFKLIVIPYVGFTLLYILFSATYLKGPWTFDKFLTTFIGSVLTGNQFFLYFIVISMQLYLLFPFFVWAFRKLPKPWHLFVFLLSFAVQVTVMWINKHYWQTMDINVLPHWLMLLMKYRDRNILLYQFWFVAGALLAIHYERIRGFFDRRPWIIYGFTAVMTVALWGHFFLDRLVLGQDETLSVLVLQPIMIPYSLAITALLWRLGSHWDAIRQAPRIQWFSRFIYTASSASFGVFLIHPLALHYMSAFVYQVHPNNFWRTVLIPLSILVVYGVSIVIARIIGNLPWVSYLVGQKAPIPDWAKRFRSTGVSAGEPVDRRA